jgi:hypothetical protein
MVQTLECASCGTGSQSSRRSSPGRAIQCGTCNVFFLRALEHNEELRCDGDDDDGGAASNSSEADESGADQGNEGESEGGDDEEDDGKGGKKKKKKAEARAGCGFMFYGIAALVLLSCCGCTIVGYMTGLIKPGAPPSIAGNWELKDTDGIDHTLVLSEGGMGSYTKAAEKPNNFKWKTSEPRTAEFEMDDATTKFWTNESKSSFTYELAANKLTLSAGSARATTFTKVGSDDGGGANKGGGTPKKTKKK